MIRYGLKTDIRVKVSLVIVFISLLLGNYLFYFLNDFLLRFSLVRDFINKWEYLGIPSQITVLSLYAFLTFCFNHCIWKCHFFVKISDVPNLNGKWEGALSSSHLDSEGNPTKIRMTLEIQQTWEKIKCVSTFDESSSSCDVVCIDTTSPEGVLLKFTYLNKSRDIISGMPQYGGYNELCITKNQMVGQYYTARIPQTYGKILLFRVNPCDEINEDVTGVLSSL